MLHKYGIAHSTNPRSGQNESTTADESESAFNIAALRSALGRRDFIRLLGLTGLGLGVKLGSPHAEKKVSYSAISHKPPRRPYELRAGVEIGTSKVRVAVGQRQPNGVMKILGVGEARSCGIREGEIVDLETATQCLRTAVADAERKTDTLIRSIYLSVTGAHLQSLDNRACVVLPEDRHTIEEQDVEDLKFNARNAGTPTQNAFLHSLVQGYHVDGRAGVLNPIGMSGQKLEADFHLIHGVRSRIQTSIRCAKEAQLEVEDVVLAALASAQVLLTSQQKSRGALLIDLGGGTTDYILYLDGAVKQSGALGVGGSHTTNDISIGLRRIFQSLKVRLENNGVQLSCLGGGIHLTGGCSLVRGIDKLAEEIFDLPVSFSRPDPTIAGIASIIGNPRYSCAIGLLNYWQPRL